MVHAPSNATVKVNHQSESNSPTVEVVSISVKGVVLYLYQYR